MQTARCRAFLPPGSVLHFSFEAAAGVQTIEPDAFQVACRLPETKGAWGVRAQIHQLKGANRTESIGEAHALVRAMATTNFIGRPVAADIRDVQEPEPATRN